MKTQEGSIILEPSLMADGIRQVWPSSFWAHIWKKEEKKERFLNQNL